MIEVLWHGRGGQGAFTAARILGAAYSFKGEGFFALAFPSFGPERRGAPIRAFTKLSNKPLHSRSEIKKSDYIIYLDDTLFSQDSLNTLKENGKIILNTTATYEDTRIITFDATKIASEILGLRVTNTVMLGALSAFFDQVSVKDIEFAIEKAMPQKLWKGNKAVITAAYNALAKGAAA
ncbi:MAG: 2-oxoacid:acceptor oxidoreductase family protein [Fibromonadaceae bacterium]|jgi:pyruvate ferredoxin oxidoreductase gamma subunit|nr:2-oxoacid:acceptor oxidoreductase family protein [Fibromonadaceae bacterium]